MNFWKALIGNFPLVSAVSAWLIAQILKVFTGIFQERRFSASALLFGTGGMPSSHSAAVSALAISCAMSCGVGSPEFAISFLVAIIVMRDATGVRWETGEQGKALNLLMKELFNSPTPENFHKDFKELVGHTPLQVLIGSLVGIAVPFLLALIPFYREILHP